MTVQAIVRNWLKRERIYTARYSGLIQRELTKQWNSAAADVAAERSIIIDELPMQMIYQNLYKRVGDNEVSILIKEQAEPTTKIAWLDTLTSIASNVGEALRMYFIAYILDRLRVVNDNTRKSIEAIIEANPNMTPTQLSAAIRAESSNVNNVRAIRLARLEVITAANRAQLLMHDQSPFEYTKSWLHVLDAKTRATHREMNPSEFIDLWDLFQVGADLLLAPGDATAAVKETIHCRCVCLYKVKKDINGKPIRK
jgi:hypothetical protein